MTSHSAREIDTAIGMTMRERLDPSMSVLPSGTGDQPGWPPYFDTDSRRRPPVVAVSLPGYKPGL
jgi:hypothetical protein